MDGLLMYGPLKDDWIPAYDPLTGNLEHVQVVLPVNPPYMLRKARTDEICLIRGRSKQQFWALTLWGFPPLIVTADTLSIYFGLHGYRSRPKARVTTPRRHAVPELALANGHH